MPDTGRLASFQFAGTCYTTEDCLQAWDFNQAINDIVYQCGGYDKHALGTKSASFRTSLALYSSDFAKVQNLEPGTTGTFEAHPGGDSTGYIEITSTRGTVISAPISAPVNGIITMDVEIVLDDVTHTSAA